MKELSVTASAQLEIDDALLWYDAITSDLADHLLYQIDLGLQQIALQPSAWPTYAGAYRHYIIQQFPYAIIYHELPNKIEVLAFAHHKRKPLYWLDDNSL